MRAALPLPVAPARAGVGDPSELIVYPVGVCGRDSKTSIMRRAEPARSRVGEAGRGADGESTGKAGARMRDAEGGLVDCGEACLHVCEVLEGESTRCALPYDRLRLLRPEASDPLDFAGPGDSSSAPPA